MGTYRPVSSDERGARRSTAVLQIAHLRRANAGRRRMFFGRLNFGEAVVVGGDDLCGCAPLAKVTLIGGER